MFSGVVGITVLENGCVDSGTEEILEPLEDDCCVEDDKVEAAE